MTVRSRKEWKKLLTETPLPVLKQLSQDVRFQKHPDPTVTYVLDTNPNYTNICTIGCLFCAFKKSSQGSGAYHFSPNEVMASLERASKAGLTTVLLQGGIHKKITAEYLVTLVKRCRYEFPSLHPHFFSAPEIWHAAKTSKISIEDMLESLWEAGQRTIPGGGAEILSSSVHSQISPKKLTPDQWIDVHRKAHKIGFKTTATMMFGHVETPDDILDHFEILFRLQEETGGFSAFIPWSYKRANNPLGKKVLTSASKELYYRIIALSRLYLHNFDHITASWFGEGKETGTRALHFGADDFGGTIFEEQVHKAADHSISITTDEIRSLIKTQGFEPIERNAFYQKIERSLSP